MKNLLKKTLAAALAAMIVLGAAPLAGLAGISLPSFDIFASAAEEEPVWTVATDDMLVIEGNTITGYTDKLSGNIELPTKTANGTAITKIASGAFENCSAITAIKISETIIEIGYSAFKNTGLETVYFNASNCKMGIFNFGDTNNEVYSAFTSNSNLKKFVFGEKVTSIPANVCKYARNLQTVEFMGEVTEIGNYAFGDCTSLEEIDLSSVTTIGYSAFFNCNSLKATDKNNTDDKDNGTIAFSADLLAIGSCAFENCTSIKTVTIPEKVVEIGYSAFKNTGLETVYFNASNCKMSIFNFGDTNNEVYSAFTSNSNLKKFVFGEKLTSIPANVCKFAKNLQTVEFKGEVTEIGNYAFSDCPSLEEIHLAAYSKETFDFDKLTIGSNNDVVTEDIFTFGIETKTETNEEFDVTVSYISTAFNEDVKLSITETEGERENGSIDISDRENYEQISCFNIKMILADDSSTAAVQPNGKVTVKMAIPEKYIGRTNFKIVHRFSNGGRENFSTNPVGNDKKLSVSSDGKYWIFEVTSFSEFKFFASAPTVSINNKNSRNTINYGDILHLTANTTDMPAEAKLFWYVDGVKKGEGTTFDVSPASGSVEVTVKIVDANGNDYYEGTEISDSQTVTVKSGFFQKLINFFKNLFGLNRIVTQAFGFYY